MVVQTVTEPEETPELLALAAEHELIAGVVGWVDLTAPDVADALAALDRERLVGIRHQVQGEPDPRWLCRADVRRGLRAVADAGLVYDLLTIPRAAAGGDRRPCARSTTSSSSSTTSPSRRSPAASSSRGRRRCARWPRHENVVCKLSGMVTEADWAAWTVADLRPYADVVLEAFGPGRLMFGSDWPVCTLAAPYERSSPPPRN